MKSISWYNKNIEPMKKYIGIFSIILSGAGAYFLEKNWSNEIDWKKLNDSQIGAILTKQIPVLSILVFLLLSLIIYLLLRPLLQMETFYSRKQKKLRKMNHSDDQKNGLLYRWKVDFEWTGKPSISDLEIFCTRHGNSPQKFVENRCPVPDCINHNQAVNSKFIHNHWESHLVNQWEKIN
jgi:hypothetical protein